MMVSRLVVAQLISLGKKVIRHRPLYPFGITFNQCSAFACCVTKGNAVLKVPWAIQAL